MYIEICKLPHQFFCKIELSKSFRCLYFWYVRTFLSEIFKSDTGVYACNIKKIVKESFPTFVLGKVVYFFIIISTNHFCLPLPCQHNNLLPVWVAGHLMFCTANWLWLFHEQNHTCSSDELNTRIKQSYCPSTA